jgi:two-component system LytT family sensor kinase
MSTPDKIRHLTPARLPAAHLAGWILYILYEQLVVYWANGVWLNLPTIYFYVCNIGLFYAQLAVLETCITRSAPPRYLRAAAAVGLALLVTMALKLICEYLWVLPALPVTPGPKEIRYVISSDFFRCLNFAGLATLYWSASHLQDYRLAAEKAKSERLLAERDTAALEARLGEARNAYLQQQLNPHLLFNTLNFVYSSVLPFSPDGARCLQLLSEIMRFSTDGAGEDGLVSLAEEVTQVQNLIEINRYRFEGQLQVEALMEGDFASFRLLPLVLLTLTENIFKHGLVKTPGKQATLRISVSAEGQLTYQSTNYKKPSFRLKRQPGIGLKNLALRLAYTYPGRHELRIDEQSDQYLITLKIDL